MAGAEFCNIRNNDYNEVKGKCQTVWVFKVRWGIYSSEDISMP